MVAGHAMREADWRNFLVVTTTIVGCLVPALEVAIAWAIRTQVERNATALRKRCDELTDFDRRTVQYPKIPDDN